MNFEEKIYKYLFKIKEIPNEVDLDKVASDIAKLLQGEVIAEGVVCPAIFGDSYLVGDISNSKLREIILQSDGKKVRIILEVVE